MLHRDLKPIERRKNEHLWTRVHREDARIEQKGACAYCHEPISSEQTTADHVKPKKNGGATRRENIKAACRPCNLTKGHLSEAAFLNKIKHPEPTDSIYVWLAHFRRRLWLRTERACTRINRMVS